MDDAAHSGVDCVPSGPLVTVEVRSGGQADKLEDGITIGLLGKSFFLACS